MKKIGITGEAGFVGYHLYQTLQLDDSVKLVPFKREWFEAPERLATFVNDCDTIVHLAAMNRHEDPQVIYDTNVDLVKRLIEACNLAAGETHVLFSSSTQEDQDNLYGQSKKEGKRLLTAWAENSNGTFTSLKVPNVFGPFGKPNYNSVVATFCHKVAHGETPSILKDGEVGLIYINQLVKEIVGAIKSKDNSAIFGKSSYELSIAPQYHVQVSELLDRLNQYKSDYIEQGIFPDLSDGFGKDLFNTFRCYVPADHYPVLYTKHTDPRGSFVEIARTQTSGQFSFSTTVSGITRGNHFHTRKAERFAVISGKALIQLRKIGTDEVIDYYLDGENPSYVDMPIWYTHNIKNIGDSELITLFWINEPYNPDDADTYFENV
jgi:UDP-2-acetamido-2,6-beta-L-arabino-hexul-4-ose reductase